MKDQSYTQPIEPDDTQPVENSSDGSESRFNRIQKPAPTIEPQPADQFVSWYEPQPAKAIQPPPKPVIPKKAPKKRGCFRQVWLWFLLIVLLLPALFTPLRVTTLVLGIDRPPKDTWIGRSDTMILTTLPPVLPKVSMLSIPRDLWVSIGGDYQNRINTAHYFAELEQAGTGKQAAQQVVERNFGVKIDYVIRIKFDGFVEIVDALGGVTVDLPTEMSGLPAGKSHLNGTEALKFVRDRKGSDDFFRQQRGQLFISAAFKEMLNPLKWVRIPAVIATTAKSVDTNLPFWLWPRLINGFVFSAVSGFDAHTIDRNYLTSWVTDEGAQVLLPNWELIHPAVQELFK